MKILTYKFDISNINLLNKLFIISDSKINIIPYNSNNTNNKININGLSGIENSTIEINISPYSNINNLYIIVENIVVLELVIKEIKTIEYNVELLNEDTYEFTDIINNNILINPTFKIEIGTKYKFLFNNIINESMDSNTRINKTREALNSYNNFIIIYDQIFNTKINEDYVNYNDIELSITICLKNNDYDKEIFYHKNNNNIRLGKFILGVYNYYHTDKLVLLNSNYIDNINKKILNIEKIDKNIDSNIIKYIEYNKSNKYYFTIYYKNKLNIINNYFIYNSTM